MEYELQRLGIDYKIDGDEIIMNEMDARTIRALLEEMDGYHMYTLTIKGLRIHNCMPTRPWVESVFQDLCGKRPYWDRWGTWLDVPRTLDNRMERAVKLYNRMMQKNVRLVRTGNRLQLRTR